MDTVKEMGIIIRSPEEIAIMREAGRVVAAVLKVLIGAVRVGMKTRELDTIAVREIAAQGGQASFKGYRGFPASICVSINEEIVHGIPGDRVIQEGDIVSLDVGAICKGFQGDAAVTVGVGKVHPLAKELMAATAGALTSGIAAAHSGAHLGDVSAAIQQCAESRGFSVIREYTGHGIGREMHEEPQVANFGLAGQGPLLVKGMTLALEPMVTTGGWRTKVSDNGWTVLTADRSLSAHFEHTIAITDGQPEILTAL